MTNPEQLLPPGFRFHPTDEELILHYLKNRASSNPCPVSIIAEVDIYKFDPWDLPEKAMFGDREWYFFSPRDRKYPNGVRPNRAAASGYWKATGTDKPITTTASSGGRGQQTIGVKKALVFYRGKPPKGTKTNWIMHEYRLADSSNPKPNHHHLHLHHPSMKQREAASMRLDDWVLCRIYEKNNHHPGTPSSDHQGSDYSNNVEESYMSTTFSNLSSHQQNSSSSTINFKLPKSGSLSDFFADTDYSALSRLLYDNNPAPDMDGQEQQLSSLLGLHPNMSQLYFNSNTNMNMSALRSTHQTEQPPPAGGTGASGIKRQRESDGFAEEGGGIVLHPSKKYIISSSNNNSASCTSYSNQLDGAPFTSIAQPYLNQNTLLNSHLKLH